MDAVSPDSISTFKNHLDKFCFNQDLKFDWKNDMTRIGSRSFECITIQYNFSDLRCFNSLLLRLRDIYAGWKRQLFKKLRRTGDNLN